MRHSVHRDGKCRTGNIVTLGRGSVKNSSTKQSIVSKSSTEAEIVVVLDGLRQDIGLMYLLEEQGYIVKIVVIYSYTRSSHMLADFYTKPIQSEIFRKM